MKKIKVKDYPDGITCYDIKVDCESIPFPEGFSLPKPIVMSGHIVEDDGTELVIKIDKEIDI